MISARFFEWFTFVALVIWGILGLGRAFHQHARGIPVIAADRRRSWAQMAVDLLALMCLLVWAYEVIASAWEWNLHLGPELFGHILIRNEAIRATGSALICGALILYAAALRDLGESWRIGIDPKTPGPLVTKGIYRWTRHPIYVAFDLIFAGAFLALGRTIFLLLACAWLPLMHQFMLREEKFLLHFYGDAYRDYSKRVGRYFPKGRSRSD